MVYLIQKYNVQLFSDFSRINLCLQNRKDFSGIGSFGCVERPALSLVRPLGWVILDRSPQAPPPPQFLGPEDFVLGTTVDINGRRLRLVDCDEFTKRYCKEHLGLGQLDQ